MREIKYRAWDCEYLCWRYGYYTKLREVGRTFHAIMSDDDGVYYIDDVETVGQYTGLKDANNFEIYEGDIVEYSMYGDFEPEYTKIYQVQFTDQCFGQKWGWDLTLKDGSCHNHYYGGFDETCCRVIGNIYKNPELLDKVYKS